MCSLTMKQSGVPGSVWQLRCDSSISSTGAGGKHHQHQQHQQQFILRSPGQATCPKSFEMPAGPAAMTRPHLMTGAIPPHGSAFVNIVLRPAQATSNVRPDVIPVPVSSPTHHSGGSHGSSGSGSSTGSSGGGGHGGGGGGRRIVCDLCREERKRRKGELVNEVWGSKPLN